MPSASARRRPSCSCARSGARSGSAGRAVSPTMLRALGARVMLAGDRRRRSRLAAGCGNCSPTWRSIMKRWSPTRAGRPRSRNATSARHSTAIRSRCFASITRIAGRSATRCAGRSSWSCSPSCGARDIVLISDYDKGVCTPGLLTLDHQRCQGDRPARARRPDPRPRLSQVPRLLGHHAQSARGGPGDRPRASTHSTTHSRRPPTCARSSIWKPRSSRSTRTAWRCGIATAEPPISRPGHATSTTSPAPATW